jgi:hypothetical protein
MIYIGKWEKVRIQLLLGCIYELFYESKVDIRELVRGHIHYLKFWRVLSTIKTRIAKRP